MKNVEEQILSYPHLSVEKQREVEAYVESHPEWASLLQDVRSLESLVRSGGDGGGPADPDGRRDSNALSPLLTTYVVVQHLHPEKVPPALEEAFRRLEREMEDDPDLRQRAQAARRRVEEAEAAIDPVAHFEKLTGHTLEGDVERETVSSQSDASRSAAATDREAARPLQSFVDELLRLPLGVRWAGAAVAVLLGTYVALFAASEASQSTMDRLAAVKVSNQIVDNYASTATRSAVPTPDTLTADQLYIDALKVVRKARTSTLGLFPSYDDEELDRAERLLNRVIDRTESGSFLALEARFYLGKVYLAQGRVEPARASFKTVVEREGRMAEEARDILETLHQEYPSVQSEDSAR